MKNILGFAVVLTLLSACTDKPQPMLPPNVNLPSNNVNVAVPPKVMAQHFAKGLNACDAGTTHNTTLSPIVSPNGSVLLHIVTSNPRFPDPITITPIPTGSNVKLGLGIHSQRTLDQIVEWSQGKYSCE
ncbi:hypothetical protein ACIU1J_04605 [Azospirillum doebereinerae]|uniref:hypothetical protein n=1 Tax=Azospirillum doebereinerae TaxID=92933 RepID=UPI001EE54700|nr:hypothetical protein [Azospirillum doebereinerae]MCG5242637.1 hypothetical protein [Azospirillum doebereinerae]